MNLVELEKELKQLDSRLSAVYGGKHLYIYVNEDLFVDVLYRSLDPLVIKQKHFQAYEWYMKLLNPLLNIIVKWNFDNGSLYDMQ